MSFQNPIFVFIFLCLPLVLPAQSKALKWGEIPPGDLRMTIYPEDSSASKVVLQDVGKITLSEVGNVFFQRYRRIKILDASALDQGNLMIQYRDTKLASDLRDLDVQITLPDGTRQKVKSDNIYTEKLARGWSAKKIFIPNLQKGAVIEYRYEIRSGDMFTLHDWYFQEDVPVRWSEVEVKIPKHFDYIVLSNTHQKFDLRETRDGIQTGGTINTTNIWGLANQPALKEEPYVTSIDDYRSSLKFQLRAINYRNRDPQTIVSNWLELAKELTESTHLGEQYLKSGNFDELWEAFSFLLREGDAPEVIAEKALRFVSSNIKWNGDYRVFTSADLDDAYEKKTGSSAELNLALVALLRKAGLKASPLLLSTRSNGQMYPAYPFAEQFNSVIAGLEIGSKILILDATNPFLPIDQLNVAHYHGSAWKLDAKIPEWLQIMAPEASQTWYGKMELNEEGELVGSFQIQAQGQFATDWREGLNNTPKAELLKKEFAAGFADKQLDSIDFSGTDELDKPISAKFKCRIPGAASVVNDFIYCQPVLDFFVMESPFKSLDRTFPVEFVTPFKAQYVVELRPPPGYSIEELPAPARVNLSNNTGKMSFNCSKNPNGDILVILKMNIAATEFSAEDYGALRQFFEIVVEKTQLQMVLKKT